MSAWLETDFSAGYGDLAILHRIRLSMNEGEILGLAGASGGGKSTLALALLNLLRYRGGFVEGQVHFRGQDILTMPEAAHRQLLGARIAFIPPSPHLALNPRLSLLRHFREVWRAHSERPWSTGIAHVEERLNAVDLPSSAAFLRRLPGEISTGQAQRVLIATALLHHPELIVADEPTTGLDMVTQAGLLDLLRHINREEGTAILCVTHDLLAAASLCHRLAVLSAGRIAEIVSTDHLAEARHPATLALLEAIPRLPEGLYAHTHC